MTLIGRAPSRWRSVRGLLLALVVAGVMLPLAAAAFLPGDGKGAEERDCYIGLEGYAPSDLVPVDKKGKKLGIRCTDCDPTCDLDGVGEPDGGCTFRIAACVNQADVAGCDPVTRTPKKLAAKAKSKAGKLDLGTTFPVNLAPACSELVDFRVPLKGKQANKPGKGTVTLLAKSPTDKDRFVFVCDPRPEGEACSAGATTTTSPTIPGSTTTSTTTVGTSLTSTTTVSGTTSTTICVGTAGAFCDLGDGTVFDAGTGLQWEQKDGADGTPGSGGSNVADLHDVDNRYTWAGQCSLDSSVPCQPSAGAAALCAAQTGGALGCSECGAGEGTCNPNPFGVGITTVWEWLAQLNAAGFAGHADWRIASVGDEGGAAELESLADLSQGVCGGGSGACIDPLLGPTVADGYWSAATFGSTPTTAWLVYFNSGSTGLAGKTQSLWVRAVRTAP